MTNTDRTSGYTDEEMNAMYDEYMSTPTPPADMATAIAARMEEEGYDEWLVPGVLSSELTQVYGQRESGKSSFIRQIIAPLSQGKPVFDVEPSTGTKPLNIAVVGTDPGAQQEYVSKLQEAGYNPATVGVIYAGDGEIPPELYDRADYGAVDLVVIDNLAGLVPGRDLNDSSSAGAAWMKYEPFIKAGVPVVVVAHRGKGGGGSTAGSHQHEAKPRFRLEVTQTRGKLEVVGAGNLGKSKLVFSIGEGFSLTLERADLPDQEPTLSGQKRSPETLDANHRVWELATQSMQPSLNKIAEELSPLVGLGESTIKKKIKDGVPKHLTVHDAVPIYRWTT